VLDSLEQTLSTPGSLGKEQLAWLAESLDANPNKPALVMVHHNPGIDGNLGLKDTVEFFEIIRPRKQVKAYIFGHTHRWNLEQDDTGLHLINLPPVAYVFQEGDPSGWVHAAFEEKGMRLELRCVDTSHKAHGQVHHLKWRA
jgi:3',5'-cyclic AMP phosphodiesterase CpdA